MGQGGHKPLIKDFFSSYLIYFLLSPRNLGLGKQSKFDEDENRTEQNRTEQNRTEQNRTEQNRTEQKTAEKDLKWLKIDWLFMKLIKIAVFFSLKKWFLVVFLLSCFCLTFSFIFLGSFKDSANHCFMWILTNPMQLKWISQNYHQIFIK